MFDFLLRDASKTVYDQHFSLLPRTHFGKKVNVLFLAVEVADPVDPWVCWNEFYLFFDV